MIERDALPEDQRRFHDAVAAIRRRPISGPFITLLNSAPDLAARFAHLGHYFHARGQADESILSVRVRTFIALILSRALDSPYEWAAWLGWAVDAGIPHETADALRLGKPPHALTPEDALVLDFCTQLLTGNHRVSSATYTSALDHFGAQGALELACTLGYFAMIAFPLNAFEIEMSTEQKGNRKPFEPLRYAGAAGTPTETAPVPAAAKPRSDKAPSRIPRLTRHEDIPREHQHFFDRIVMSRGRISAPFQVLLNSPDVAARIAHVGDFLLYDTVVPPDARTLTSFIAAREYDCDYEVALAAAHARKAGVDGGLIEAISKREPLPSSGREHALLIEFCLQLLRGNHHVSEETHGATIEHFGVPATVQIAATIGYFVMWAFVLNASRWRRRKTRPGLRCDGRAQPILSLIKLEKKCQ
jgi:4-carboxymuconolactone decarboxylase